jgi:hypothetical protein
MSAGYNGCIISVGWRVWLVGISRRKKMSDSKLKNDMLEALKMMVESMPKAPFRTGTLFASMADRDQWEKARDGRPMKVQYSSFLESGRAYVIEESKVSHKIPPPSFDKQLADDIRYRIASAFAIPSSYWQPDIKPYVWQRQSGETITAWGIRLDKRGLLDDPSKRWEYQKAVWYTVFQPMRRLWVTMKGFGK